MGVGQLMVVHTLTSRFYALLLPRWKYVWLLTATLWLTKMLSKHVDYCRSAGLCMLACVVPVYTTGLLLRI